MLVEILSLKKGKYNMSILCGADFHFGHKNILKYCHRPFANIIEHDEALIKNWNSVVKHHDEIHVVGDFAYGCTMEYALSIVKRLNGTKHLVTGNHDELALEMNSIRSGTWKTIKDLSEIYIHNQRVILMHYAMRTWHHSYRGTGHLFGHTHGTLPSYGKSFDCGVDCHDFTPWSSKQIIEKLDSLPNSHAIPKDRQWDKITSGITG